MDYADSLEVARRRAGALLNGRWRIVRPVTSGGSAWVYVATDDKRELPPVAVKVLHLGLAQHPAVVERFTREARLAGSIGHRGIVHIYDEGVTADRVPFLVMDLLEGETLEERRIRKGGTLPVKEVMWAADLVLSVLAAAHERGVLHRDIKPDNIFLTHRHDIKLLDFGIARLLAQVSSSETTQRGTMIGTLDYMSPEQGRGEWDTVGVTTDLWAVGATMFSLLTGRAVHDQIDLYAQMRAVMNERAPAMREVAPGVPRSVQVLVDQALEFDADLRWKSAGSMQLALRLAYYGMNDTAPPDSTVSSDRFERARVPRPPIYFAPSLPPISSHPRSKPGSRP